MGLPDSQRLSGVHILVVDDNRDARDILTTLLQYHGALVTRRQRPTRRCDGSATSSPTSSSATCRCRKRTASLSSERSAS